MMATCSSSSSMVLEVIGILQFIWNIIKHCLNTVHVNHLNLTTQYFFQELPKNPHATTYFSAKDMILGAIHFVTIYHAYHGGVHYMLCCWVSINLICSINIWPTDPMTIDGDNNGPQYEARGHNMHKSWPEFSFHIKSADDIYFGKLLAQNDICQSRQASKYSLYINSWLAE